MRTIPDDFDPDVVTTIDARLDAVERDHGVRVPWAIESGSRAWGCSSPDSDYDCRFFFVGPARSYADLWPGRDVIETPLEGLLDVNGWDVRKAVRLAVAGNATVGEWLRSPWVYRGDPEFRDALLALVSDVADRSRLRRHYVHVGRGQWSRSGARGGRANLKRVFYAVRPAATLVWLDQHDGVPPMNLDELVEQTSIPEDVLEQLAALRALKSRTRELGDADVPPAIARWVEQVLDAEPIRAGSPSREVKDRAADAFMALVERWAPAS